MSVNESGKPRQVDRLGEIEREYMRLDGQSEL